MEDAQAEFEEAHQALVHWKQSKVGFHLTDEPFQCLQNEFEWKKNCTWRGLKFMII